MPEGLGKLLNTIKKVQELHNESLNIEGLLLTMFDSRLRLSNQVAEEVPTFEGLVFETIIHRNMKLSEAPSYGENIIAYDAGSKGAENSNFSKGINRKRRLTHGEARNGKRSGAILGDEAAKLIMSETKNSKLVRWQTFHWTELP